MRVTNRAERRIKTDPQKEFCHNLDCSARGKVGLGNIGVHSQKDRRYICMTCGRTFAESKGTPSFRLHKPIDLFVVVVTLLTHGCPLQAIVVAFGLDERTVASWQHKAGLHCEKVHEAIVQQGKVDLGHVQADELWVKMVGRKVWMAMAMAVPSRLWLAGAISEHRDSDLITRLVQGVRACASSLAILVCVDGLASYVKAFLRVFRNPLRTGKPGRPQLLLAEGLLIGQVVKQYAKRRVSGVTKRVAHGTTEAIDATFKRLGGGNGINTSYIERLNATFREHLTVLTRRGRAIAHQERVVQSAMYLVGCSYNFCWHHASLRLRAPAGADHKWQERTPAMAAGLTDHRWTLSELLHFKVAPPPWVPPKRRGRPRKQAPEPAAGAVR